MNWLSLHIKAKKNQKKIKIKIKNKQKKKNLVEKNLHIIYLFNCHLYIYCEILVKKIWNKKPWMKSL